MEERDMEGLGTGRWMSKSNPVNLGDVFCWTAAVALFYIKEEADQRRRVPSVPISGETLL